MIEKELKKFISYGCLKKKAPNETEYGYSCPVCGNPLAVGYDCLECNQEINWKNTGCELTLTQVYECGKCTKKDGQCDFCSGDVEKCKKTFGTALPLVYIERNGNE